MRIMTRVTPKIWEILGDNSFVKCIHSVGVPEPVKGNSSSILHFDVSNIAHSHLEEKFYSCCICSQTVFAKQFSFL